MWVCDDALEQLSLSSMDHQTDDATHPANGVGSNEFNELDFDVDYIWVS